MEIKHRDKQDTEFKRATPLHAHKERRNQFLRVYCCNLVTVLPLTHAAGHRSDTSPTLHPILEHSHFLQCKMCQMCSFMSQICCLSSVVCLSLSLMTELHTKGPRKQTANPVTVDLERRVQEKLNRPIGFEDPVHLLHFGK